MGKQQPNFDFNSGKENPDKTPNFNFNTTEEQAKEAQKAYDERTSSILAKPLANSKYETDSMFKDQEEFKAEQQTALDKWSNGLVKMAGTAATSFAEPFVDIVYGIPKAIVDGKFSSVYDNEISRKFDQFNEYLQTELPTYYTKEQLQNGLLESMGTANFWSDKVLNGLGFAAGALASSYLTMGASNVARGRSFFNAVSKLGTSEAIVGGGDEILNALKLAKTTRYKDGSQLLFTQINGAIGESGMEARTTKKDIFEKLKTQKEDELLRELSKEELSEIDDIASAAGNTSFALNMALVGGSNFLQFGKLFNKGYQGEKRVLNNIAKNSEGIFEAAPLSKLQKLGKAGKILETNFIEATQEQLQYATQKGIEDFVTKSKDKKNQETINSLIESSLEGLEQAYGTKEGIEQGLIGSIIGSLTGGNIRSLNENKQKEQDTNEAVDILNSYKLKDKIKPLYDDAVRQLSYQAEKDQALKEGDQFAYQNANDGAFKSYVKSRIDTGEFDSFIEDLHAVSGLSSNEVDFKKTFGFDKNQPLPKHIDQFIEGLVTKAKEIQKISTSLDTNFSALDSDSRDIMFDAMTSITDINRREKKLAEEVSKISKGQISYHSLLDQYKDNYKEQTIPLLEEEIKAIEETDTKELPLKKKEKEEYNRNLEEKKAELAKLKDDNYDPLHAQLEKTFESWSKNANPQDVTDVKNYLNDLPRVTAAKKRLIENYNNLLTKEGREKVQKDIKKREDKRASEQTKLAKEIEDNSKKEASKKVVEILKEKAKEVNNTFDAEDFEAFEKANSEAKQEIKLSQEQVEVLKVETKVNSPILADGQFEGATKKEKDLQEEAILNAIRPKNDKGDTISPQGKVIAFGDLVIPAASSFAYLTKEYIAYTSVEADKAEDKKITASNEIQAGMKEPKLLSHSEYQVGTQLILEVDRTFNISTPNRGEITYEDLRKRELSENKDGLLIPIAIKNAKTKKIIAYLHDIDWINNSNVAQGKNENNVELQKDILKRIRKAILDNGGKIETSIVDKSLGKLSKNINKDRVTSSEALPDPNLRIAIGKNSKLYTGVEDSLVMDQGENLIDKKDRKYINGSVYAILPTPVEGKNLSVPLDTKKISEDQATSIANVIEAHFTKNEEIKSQIEENTGINIFTPIGLREYVSTFVYTNSFNKTDVDNAVGKENKKFLDIVGSGIVFSKGGDIIKSIGNIDFFNKYKQDLIDQLKDSYVSTSLIKLEKNKEFKISLVKEGKVENKTYNNYVDFIKDHTETNLVANKISEIEWSYFDQPVIVFDNSFISGIKQQEIPETFSIANPATEPKPKEVVTTEQGADGEEVLVLPSEEDELPSLSNEQVDAILDDLNEIIIPGFTSYKQNEIVKFLSAQVNEVFKNNEKSLEPTFKKWHDFFAKGKGNKEIDLILNNWNKLKEFTIAKFSNIKLKDNFEIEGFEDIDSILDKSNFNDESSLQVDSKDTTSDRLKRFFAYIPSEKKNYLGLTSYVNPDEVMNFISANLAGLDPDYALMRTKLEDISKSNLWVKNLIIKLDSSNEQLKNEFVVYASKHYANMKMVIHSEDKSGGKVLKIIDVNQNSVGRTIVGAWLDNLRQSNIVEESKETAGELLIPISAREELVKEFNEIALNPTTEKLNNWLVKFGVNLSSETLEDLKDNSEKIYKGLSFKQLFTDTNGVFKLMVDRLKGKETENKDNSEDLLSLNNPLTDNQGITVLSQLEAKYTSAFFSNSHKDGEGKTVFSYALNKYFTNKFRELTTNSKTREELLKISFSSTSNWLKELSTKNSYFKQSFNFFYFDTIKKDKKNQTGVKLKSQSAREHEISKIGLFQNQANGKLNLNQRLAHFLYPTMSDKTTMLGITAIAHDTRLNSNGTLSNDTIDTLTELVKGEYTRILRFQKLKAKGKEPKIEGYSQGANKFFFFPSLNTLDIWAGDSLLDYTEEVQLKIKNKLQETIALLVKDKIEEWTKLGIVGDKFFDSTYMSKVVDARLETKNEVNRINYTATDYVVNYLIANGNAHQMFIGDPALFYKKSKGKTSDIEETFINIGKRLAKEIAPGLDIPNALNNNYNQIFLHDRKSASTTIKYLTKLLGKDKAEAYREIEGTDAQEYTTLYEHLYILTQLGKISKEESDSIYNKYKARKKLNMKELKKVLQPMKPVYVCNINDIDGDVSKVVYIKSSSFPLITQFTQGLEIDKLRKVMEGESGNDISRAAFKTAVKVGGSNFVNIFNEDGTIKDNLDFTNKKIQLPRTGFRIQQEVPFNEEKSKITKGSQETKLLFVNILDEQFTYNGLVVSGHQLKQEYNNLHQTIYKDSAKELLKQLEAKDDFSININKLRKLLVTEATERGYPLNDIRALDLIDIDQDTKTFKLPIWASSSANKFESLLNSIVDNKVRKRKMAGFSGVLGSEEGLIGDARSSDIAWLDGYDTSKGLQGQREEDGIIKPAQVIVPFKFRDTEGNLLDISKFIKTENGKKIVDSSKMPSDILKLFGFRIPTQGHNSMAYMEIVGFLPYEMGDLIICSRDFTKQMGSDFDVDKLNSYMYKTHLNEDGVLVKSDSIENKILDIHITVMSTNNDKIQRQIHEPLGFGKLKELADKYKVNVETISPLSDAYQKNKYINATAGKAGVGVFSLDSTFNASIQGLDISIKEEIGNIIFKDKKGNLLSNPNVINGNRTKSDVISAYQSAAVDNEKEQILDKLNINNFTFDAIRALNQSGFEEDTVAPFLLQPIIKEYVEEMKKAQDSTQDEFILNAKDVVIKNLVKKYIADDAISEDIEGYNIEYPLSIEEMEREIIKPTKYTQIYILAKFVRCRDIGEKIAQVQSAINTDSSGFGKSLFDSFYKEIQVKNLFNNEVIENSSKLIGEYETDNDGKFTGKIIPKTINGYATVYGLMINNELWRKFFPYDSLSLDKAFEEIQNITGKQLKSDDYKDIFEGLKSYLYSDIFSSNNRKDLFYDSKTNKSIATRVKEYKATKIGSKNAFIARLAFDINPTGKKPSLIKYNAAAGENLDELNVYQGFADLLLTESTRELATDLIAYSYLSGGKQEAINFIKYIPTSYLNNTGFSDHLRNIEFNDIDIIQYKGGYPNVSSFTKQYIQHNPSKASRFKLDDVSISSYEREELEILEKYPTHFTIKKDKTKNFFVTRFIESINKVSNKALPEFLSIYDKKIKGFVLYEYKGNYKYVQIKTKGNDRISEYDILDQNKIITTNSIDERDQVIKDNEVKDLINPIEKENLIEDYSLNSLTLYPDTFSTIAKSKNKAFAELGNLILIKFDELNLRDVNVESTTRNVRGAFNNKTRTLKYNIKKIDNASELEKVVLHETIHAIVNDTITNPKTQQQKDIVASLDVLRSKLKEYIDSNPKTKKEFEDFIKAKEDNKSLDEYQISKYYGAYNTKEFVTMALTDRDFQLILNSIPFTNDKSLWQRFNDLITKILNTLGFKIESGSLLEHAIGNSISLINLVEKNSKDENTNEDALISKDNSISIENEFGVRNKEGERKRFTLYDTAFNLAKTINKSEKFKTSYPNYKASIITIKGEKGDIRTYNAIKISPIVEEDSLPSSNKYQKIIEERLNRITTINKNIAKFSEDRDKVVLLIETKKRLEREIENLTQESNLSDVILLGEQDLREVRNILSQPKVSESDLFYGSKILTSLENYLDTVFEEKDLESDNEGNFSANVMKVKELTSTANILRIKLTKLELSTALQVVNKLTGREYKAEEIFGSQKEIGTLAANLMDISRSGSIALDVLDKLMRDASFSTNTEATKIFSEVDKLLEGVRKTPEFIKDKFKIFAQKTSKGKLTGNLVDRYSQEFYNERNKQLKYAKDSKSQKEGWTNFFQWKKQNQIVFDSRKLFNSVFSEYGGSKFSSEDITKHIEDIKTQVGEERYKELYERLKGKIDLYKKDYKATEERIENLDIEDGAIKAGLLEEWTIENSPFYYAESVYDGIKKQVQGKFIIPRGYNYTLEVPRRIDTKGNKTEWYDKDFEKIENNKILYDFYNYTIDTFQEMYSNLPESKTQDLQYNYLPEIKKNVMELYNEEGMKAGLVGWYDKFIESITTDETSQIVNSELDPITKKPIQSLPINMIGSNLTAEEKSYDLGKIVKAFSMMSLSYKHKSKVEDSIRLMKGILDNSLEKQLTATNNPKIDKFGNVIETKHDLKNFRDQMEYAVDSFYGNRRKVQGVSKKKAYTLQEKKEKEELAKMLKSEEITQQVYDDEISKLGSNIAYSKVGDQVLQYIQLKGMGWNIFSSMTNTFFGFMSNLTHAAGGEDFTMNQYMKANSIMLNSTLKSASLNTHSNKVAAKVNALMEKYHVMSELYESANISTLRDNTTVKGLKQLSPYELQRRSEYYNQGSTFIATMLNTPLQTLKGDKINLWEAYDDKGEFKTELFDEQTNKNWNGDINKAFENLSRKNFKSKLTQINKSIHGNYDPDSPVRIKKTVGGRALMQFRSWIAEGFANRFEEEKEDLLLGRKRKGRYRTYVDLGFTGSIKEFYNVISGKSKLNAVDLANMRKNLAELSMYTSLYALAVLVKGLTADDDDDETQYMVNLFLNQASRIQSDVTFYTSPLSFEKLTRSSIPAFSLVKDIDEFRVAVGKYMTGDDIIKSGTYKGHSRLLREGSQLFPFGTQVYRNYSSVAETYD